MEPLDPAEKYLRYNVNEVYRVPLWELVFHDCVYSAWHWHDNSQKMRGLWDQRDLLNILYGTAPMWMLTKWTWEVDRARFLKCYCSVCTWHAKIAFAELLDHRALTADRRVQQSRFDNGWSVIVNFSQQRYLGPGGPVEPQDFVAIRESPASP